VILTYLTTTVFLYQKYHQEDGRITGRNMLVKIINIKIHHKIKVHLLVVHTFYIILIRFKIKFKFHVQPWSQKPCASMLYVVLQTKLFQIPSRQFSPF